MYESDILRQATAFLIDKFGPQVEVHTGSANFTEAAQERNIEIGVCLHSSALAMKLEAFLDGLVASQKLTPLTLQQF